jgi:peptidoglycan L-alanyl-D-glutamate endopeptidase CwlK
MDQISLNRIDFAHPKVRAELREILEECDRRLTGKMKVRYAWTMRTMQEQRQLYEQGRTRPGKVVTWAKPGTSWHNYGLAVDICLIDQVGKMASWDTKSDFDADKKADWMEAVEVFKAKGWEWGGDWPETKRDTPHFQKTFGLTIQEALNRVKQYEPYIKL